MRMVHKLVFFLMMGLLCVAPEVYSMIRTLPVDRLVLQSNYIVIGEVKQIEVDRLTAPDSSGMSGRYLTNTVVIVESLKGEWPLHKPMIFRTVNADRWIEDKVEFPPPGTRMLLFVEEQTPGHVGLVNGIQGLWPLRGDQPQRMGTRYTVDQIRRIIREQAATAR